MQIKGQKATNAPRGRVCNFTAQGFGGHIPHCNFFQSSPCPSFPPLFSSAGKQITRGSEAEQVRTRRYIIWWAVDYGVPLSWYPPHFSTLPSPLIPRWRSAAPESLMHCAINAQGSAISVISLFYELAGLSRKFIWTKKHRWRNKSQQTFY